MDGVMMTTAAQIEAHNRRFLEEACREWAKRWAAEIDAKVLKIFYGNAGCA